MMDENRLNQILMSNTRLKEKKQLLLTQIGYLRINIFSEYLEQVNRLQENGQLHKAAELMNEHSKIASAFIDVKNRASLVKQVKKIFKSKTPEPIEYLDKWRIFYKKWSKQESSKPIDTKKQVEEFQQLKMAFIELYTFSFSVDNFPPLRYRRLDHQSYPNLG